MKPTHCLRQDDQVISLEWVESILDLGVLIDERLSFTDHIHDKINKAYAMLRVIKRNFKYLTTTSLILLQLNVVPLQKERYWIFRKGPENGNQIVARTQKMTNTDRLKSCKLLTLHYRRIQGDMIEIYKIVSGKYDSLAAPVLPGPHSYVTTLLRLQQSRAKYDLHKFFFLLIEWLTSGIPYRSMWFMLIL